MAKINIPEDISKKIIISFGLLLSTIALAGFIISKTNFISISKATMMATAFAAGLNADELVSAAPALRAAMLMLGFGGTVLSFYVFYLIFEYAISGQLHDALHGVKKMAMIKNLDGHHIICGAGRVGRHVGLRLKQRGENVIFIEKDQPVIDRLTDEKHLIMNVGPIDEKVLLDAGIKKAKGLVATLGDDSKNLLLVLTARELNPYIKIAVRVNDAKLIQKFKRAGANFIILPEAIGGVKLADALLGNITSDVITNQNTDVDFG